MSADNQRYRSQGPDPVRYLDTQDLADRFQCSKRHVQRLVAAGQFPRPTRIGSLARWPSEVIDRWAESARDCVNPAASSALHYKEDKADAL